MKYEYRISKYDPKNRNPGGTYARDEWSAISDIGKKFGNARLTKEVYLSTEKEYIEAIVLIMRELDIPFLQVKGLNRGKKQGLREDLKCSEKIVRRIVRGALRENLWCWLHLDRKMFVHFGYDYYMWVGVAKKPNAALSSIRRGSLFVESRKSPYLPSYRNYLRREAAKKKK